MKIKYIIKNNDINVASEKKWLTRHGYSKIAVKVFGQLAKTTNDISDAAVSSKLRLGIETYREAKRELVMAGLLEVHRINASTVLYLIGTKAIAHNAKHNQKREDDRLIRLTLEHLGLSQPVYENTIEEVHTTWQNDTKIPLPKPIGDIDCGLE